MIHHLHAPTYFDKCSWRMSECYAATYANDIHLMQHAMSAAHIHQCETDKLM